MSKEKLKAAETEATAQVEEGVEEISEEDLDGVAGGVGYAAKSLPGNMSAGGGIAGVNFINFTID